MLMAQAATVLSPSAKSRLQRLVLELIKLTWAMAEAVEKERRPVAEASRHTGKMTSSCRNAGSLLRRCGGSHVLVCRCRARLPLPRASAKRSLLPPKVLDDCSYVGRKLSPHDRAIIREVNESVFALNFLDTGCRGLSESCEKVGYSILSTDLASPAPSKPPSVTDSGEATLRRLLASRAIGGCWLTSVDPAP